MKIGDLIAERFRLQRLAGSGAMGTVYLAEDLATGQPVAVKVLHSADPKIAERFVREAEILLQLDHPSVVRYVASGRTDSDERWLAMEWLDGEDLGVRLARGPGLTVAESVQLARKVAEGLGAAHRLGVVHRDVKPGNLFLVGRDPTDVRILDFGVARLTDLDRRMTATGATLGTPSYMSPEQASGQGQPDARVDVFALGAVLYECLVGRLAYPGESLMEILSKILFSEPPRVREARPDLPEALDRVVARLMAKDRIVRYPDGDAAAAALQALQAVHGDRPGAPAQTALTLTAAEQRFVSIVILSAERENAIADLTMTEQDLQVERHAVRTAARMFGFRLEEMSNGSLVAILEAPGLPQEQIDRSARYALRLREQVPDAPIALATGWGVIDTQSTLGAVIERALRLLHQDGDPASVRGVRVDPDTAALLDARFVVDQAGGTLVLETERDRAEAVRAVLGRPTVCVGRQQELALLEATFSECQDEGEARAVLVTAAPGMGKTRVAFELLARLRQSGADFALLQARGDPLSAGSAWGLLGRAIRRWAGVSDGGDPVAQRRLLDDQVGAVLAGPDRGTVVNFLGEITGLKANDDDPALRAARADPALMAAQTTWACVAFARAVSRHQPLLLVLDDVQWGDLPSLRAIDAVLRELKDAGVMALALGRPEMHQQFPGLWRDRGATEVKLGRLPPKACERVVVQVLGRDVEPALLAEMLDRAEGNPFCLEELMRHVAFGKRGSFPDSVLGMVQARLDALEQIDRRVLRAASVFGRTFWLGGVVSLLGGPDRLAEVHDSLVRLGSLELVQKHDSAVLPGEVEYGLPSAMVHDAAYAMLTGHDRTLGHRLAGEWLAQQGERNPLVLAEHAFRGGQAEQAAAHYLQAAQQAQEAQDTGATLDRAERGLQCGATGPLRGRLLLLQADALEWKGDVAAAEEAAIQAEALLQPGSAAWFLAATSVLIANARHGVADDVQRKGDRIAATPPDDDEARARQVMGLCRGALNAMWVGRYDLAEQWIAEADRAAGGLRGRDLLASARLHYARGYLATNRGALGEALVEFAAAAQAWDRAGDVRSRTGVRTTLANVNAQLGNFSDAEHLLRDCLATCERLGLGFLQVVVEHNLGTTLALAGDVAAGLRIKEPAVQRLVEAGQARMDGNVRASLAELLLLAGRTDEAEADARRAVDLLAPFPPTQAYALAVHARALLDLDRPDEALARTRQAMALLDHLGGMEEGEHLLRCCHAEALHATGHDDEAVAALQTALDVLNNQAQALPEPVRAAFLQALPARRRTRDLARAWGLLALATPG